MPLAAGTRLGIYEVVAPIGAGGMGEVYRAHDTRLSRDVAIKILPASLASSPDRLARFEREAKTVAGLNHPNIVVLYSIEEQDGIRFLTMELVEGRDLSTTIVPGGLTIAQVLDLAIPLADALVAAHERRVVHRDLKPANVMLTRDGRLKVLDFGLAKLLELDADLEQTHAASAVAPISDAGLVVGTVPYMAPEQIRGEEVDARADLFSFGIVVFELATGKRPFGGKSFLEVSSAVLHENPPSLTSVRGELPADLGRIIGRCLEKNPRERFQTALDVANELRALKRTLERGSPDAVRAPTDKTASIAVLPFVNRSASADDEYFSDGLADELLNVLVKIRGLRVAARTSAFYFKGKTTTIAEVGAALHVDTVLEGSVRKAGNRVRISVQLVKVADGYHLWSETYDRTMDDIFAVQDDIARSVVKELRATLLGEDSDSKASGEVKAEVSSAVKGRGTNPEAHRLYLQARHLVEQFKSGDIAKAVEYLKRALDLDPAFALGWAELGQAFASEGDFSLAPMSEAYARARQAVERGLTLEPDLAEGHAALGWIQSSYEGDWPAAEISFRRALEVAPGNVLALRRYGVLLMTRGHVDEAIALYRRALSHDPLNSHAYHNLGSMLVVSGSDSEAEQAYRKALEFAPQKSWTHAYLSFLLIRQGRTEEAVAEVEMEPDELYRLWAQALIQQAQGNEEESAHTLRKMIDGFARDSAFQIAEVCAVRGDIDEAFSWLARADEQRDPGLKGLMTSPRLRALHADPRWDVLLTKLGLRDS